MNHGKRVLQVRNGAVCDGYNAVIVDGYSHKLYNSQGAKMPGPNQKKPIKTKKSKGK